MEALKDLVLNHQSFLIKRTLEYARLHNYVKYTSTLEEAWVKSISGLSEALLRCISMGEIPEIDVDQDNLHDPITSFGVMEAQLHRHRGIRLEMFLGLMKYYRQSYLDLIIESISQREKRNLYLLWVNRFFDRNEIAFCVEWIGLPSDAVNSELQAANRKLANEKNKYLTIFESIPAPIVLLDAKKNLRNMNYAAQQLLHQGMKSPGYIYYNDSQQFIKGETVLPWIVDEIRDFYESERLDATMERDYVSPSHGKRNLTVKFHRMLDVSNKFEGTIIIFSDITERKKIEEQLRHLSFHDMLTGLYNRTYLTQEMIRLSAGRLNPIGVISCDIDGLKLVNDTLGHNAGDALITTVSQIILGCFRENDVVARVGGDEFLVLLPSSNCEVVQEACQRIRGKIAEYNLREAKAPISISAGWSSGNPASYTDIEELIKTADSRMYKEKKNNHPQYANLFKQRLAGGGPLVF